MDLINARENFKDLPDQKTALRVFDHDRLYYKVVIVASSIITYIGENVVQGEDRATPTWRVSRVTIIGSETITQFADNGEFTQAFDDPESLFPAVSSSNVYSTNFDGINDYCNGGNVHNYDAGVAFSISFWIKPNNTAAVRILFSKATTDANVYGYRLYHLADGTLNLQMRAAGYLTNYNFTTLTLTSGVWQQVVFTYSGAANINGARCYINNVVGGTPPSGAIGASWLSAQDFKLCTTSGGANFFSGNIDSVMVMDKGLSPTEVTELYAGGLVLSPSSFSFFANIKSWYRMGDSDVFPTISDNIGVAHLTMVNMAANDFEVDTP